MRKSDMRVSPLPDVSHCVIPLPFRDSHDRARSRFQLGAPVEYIDVERAKRKLASLAPGDEEIRCYVCLEGSTEEQPLVRDCGCRGSAGWAHYSCLADYSTLRLSTIFEDHLSGRAGIGVSSEIEETWTKVRVNHAR